MREKRVVVNTNIPKEIAVLVAGVEGGTHRVIRSVDGQYYLLHLDERTTPEINSICILVPTYERPVWFEVEENDDDMGVFSFYGLPNSLITWRIKQGARDETNN
jgi:hypothetical protein